MLSHLQKKKHQICNVRNTLKAIKRINCFKLVFKYFRKCFEYAILPPANTINAHLHNWYIWNPKSAFYPFPNIGILAMMEAKHKIVIQLSPVNSDNNEMRKNFPLWAKSIFAPIYDTVCTSEYSICATFMAFGRSAAKNYIMMLKPCKISNSIS